MPEVPKIPFRAIPQLIFVEKKLLFNWVFYSSIKIVVFSWLAVKLQAKLS